MTHRKFHFKTRGKETEEPQATSIATKKRREEKKKNRKKNPDFTHTVEDNISHLFDAKALPDAVSSVSTTQKNARKKQNTSPRQKTRPFVYAGFVAAKINSDLNKNKSKLTANHYAVSRLGGSTLPTTKFSNIATLLLNQNNFQNTSVFTSGTTTPSSPRMTNVVSTLDNNQCYFCHRDNQR